jgi:predicted negative regulator of RcsB-dependent stress response
MNDDQFADLKQFITATVSQTETRLGERIGRVETRIDKVEDRLTNLEQKMDDGFAAVAEATDAIHTQLQEHEAADKEFNQRLTKLEQHAV